MDFNRRFGVKMSSFKVGDSVFHNGYFGFYTYQIFMAHYVVSHTDIGFVILSSTEEPVSTRMVITEKDLFR